MCGRGTLIAPKRLSGIKRARESAIFNPRINPLCTCATASRARARARELLSSPLRSFNRANYRIKSAGVNCNQRENISGRKEIPQRHNYSGDPDRAIANSPFTNNSLSVGPPRAAERASARAVFQYSRGRDSNNACNNNYTELFALYSWPARIAPPARFLETSDRTDNPDAGDIAENNRIG